MTKATNYAAPECPRCLCLAPGFKLPKDSPRDLSERIECKKCGAQFKCWIEVDYAFVSRALK